VVSWQYWKNRFNGDARVLGASIDIEDTRVPEPMHATVVGVAAREFSGVVVAYRPDVWCSLSAVPEAVRARGWLALVARLKPGASIEQARAEIRVLDRARIEELGQKGSAVAARRDRRHAGAHRPLDATAPAVWRGRCSC
jgi:hypothetical protein